MIKKIISLSLLCLMSFSCQNDDKRIMVLLESNALSNNFYEEEIRQLREYFEDKSLEQPKLYKDDYDKIKIIEKTIILITGLKTVSDKKVALQKLEKKIQELIEIEALTFVCLKINESDEALFNSVLENDCNRIIYQVYKEFYRLNYVVY